MSKHKKTHNIMNVNQVVKTLKVMLSKTLLKFAEAELVDGSQVYTETEKLEVGAILFVRSGTEYLTTHLLQKACMNLLQAKS